MNNKNGFTLVELLVVIAILGLIIAFFTPNILNTFSDAKAKKMSIEEENAADAARIYKIDTRKKDCVYISTLVEKGYLDNYIFYDNDIKCEEGYVDLSTSDGYEKTYLMCGNAYTTDGYEAKTCEED